MRDDVPRLAESFVIEIGRGRRGQTRDAACVAHEQTDSKTRGSLCVQNLHLPIWL